MMATTTRTWRQFFAISARGIHSQATSGSSLKKLIQPFVMKCHPDRAVQQGLPKTAVQVNLKAIQNLNSYVDGVAKLEKGGPYPFSNDENLVEIEFVMSFQNSSSTTSASSQKAAQPTTSRRRVELQVPPSHLPINRVTSHVQRQVVKLLRMADLPVPQLQPDENYEQEGAEDGVSSTEDIDEEWMTGQILRDGHRRTGKTPWERSRERFMRRINWTKFDKVYRQALQDAQANMMTRNMIRDNPRLRKELLARILSNIQFTESVQPLERLVAYRRLLRLLDEHFDYLRLESFGKYWEELMLVITESRPYNTSSSAMRKRRLRQMETGYQFTIHHDNSVTVQIPVDFHNDELVQELYRNVGDFYEWTRQDITGLESILDDERI